jgi:hypothetical protein
MSHQTHPFPVARKVSQVALLASIMTMAAAAATVTTHHHPCNDSEAR